jgi:RimJ/RimL family protein N-acetyltransferase
MRLEPFTLTGLHVVLEPLSPEHVPALVNAATDDRSTFGFTSVPGDPVAMAAYAAHDTAVPFVQRRVADDRIIGCTRLMNLVWWGDRDLPVEVEIGGTWLSHDAQRTAVNSEAKLLLLDHAFERWQVHRVALCTDARNEGSRRAIARIGASFEGILRRHRPSMGHAVEQGTPRDTAVYSIIDAEWAEVRQRLEDRLRGA